MFRNENMNDTRFKGEPLVYFVRNKIIKYKNPEQFKKEYFTFENTGLIDIYQGCSENLIKINNELIVKFVLTNLGDLFLLNSKRGHYTIARSENVKYAGFVMVSDFIVKISENGSDSLGKNPPRKGSIGETVLIKMIEDGDFKYYE